MELLAGLLLFALSAGFSAAETALYRADWVRLTSQAGRRRPGARTALELLEHQESTIITILIGNNLVNTFASVIFTGWFARVLGPAWASAAVVLVVAVTMVTGEYVPKSFGAAWPGRILRQAAGPLALLRVVFYPAAALLAGVARLLGPDQPGRRFSLTRQDFITAMTRRGDGAPAAVGRLVGRLFRFSATKVSDVIIPLDTVCSVPADAGRDRIAAALAEHGFSRIPVYRDEPANITGVVVAKDLLVAPAPRIRHINRVRAGDRAMDVLRRMQRRAEHIVVVEDESGRVQGIVSLEDLLEELIGEIRSES